MLKEKSQFIKLNFFGWEEEKKKKRKKKKRKRKESPRDFVENTNSWGLPSTSHLSGKKPPNLHFFRAHTMHRSEGCVPSALVEVLE